MIWIFLLTAKPSGPRVVIVVALILMGGSSLAEHRLTFYSFFDFINLPQDGIQNYPLVFFALVLAT